MISDTGPLTVCSLSFGVKPEMLDDGSYVRQVSRDQVGPPEQDPALVPCFGHRPLMGAFARSTVGVYGTLEQFINRSKHAARLLCRNHVLDASIHLYCSSVDYRPRSVQLHGWQRRCCHRGRKYCIGVFAHPVRAKA